MPASASTADSSISNQPPPSAPPPPPELGGGATTAAATTTARDALDVKPTLSVVARLIVKVPAAVGVTVTVDALLAPVITAPVVPALTIAQA